jgi:hypothetical protein
MGPPGDAPSEGVVNIVGYYRNGKRYIQHTWDFYHWSGAQEEWWGRDLWGVLRWAKDIGFITGIFPAARTVFETTAGELDLVGVVETLKRDHGLLEGVMVSNDEYNAIHTAVNHDPDFPKKRSDAG